MEGGARGGARSATRPDPAGENLSSNIGQNYPYASESDSERASAVQRSVADHDGLADKLGAESTGLEEEPRWWVWKCPAAGCRGLLHAAGMARNARAVYTVCDTCGSTNLR